MRRAHRKGFTAIELMTVIAVTAVLATLGFFSYSTIQKNIVLSNSAQELLTTLRVAQSRSVSSQDGITWGVHFDSASYILYGGAWPTPTSTTSYILPGGLTVTQGAGTEAVFAHLTGASATGNIRVGFAGGAEKTIYINANGQITL